MRSDAVETQTGAAASEAARQRLLSMWGEPLFIAGWHRVLMIHFEVDAEKLQREVPFELDLLDDRAFVSAVAFTMRRMRPFRGAKFAEWQFRPIATHEFLNVRTYVRHRGEPGIHFLAEWLSNRLAVKLGPSIFGLPYRYGRIRYEHDWSSGNLRGLVLDPSTGMEFDYRADLEINAPFAPCVRGSLDEWLMERYTAFNAARGRKKFFRVWHPPWKQCPVGVGAIGKTLLTAHWSWLESAALIGANFAPGFDTVWMGRPHGIG
jgi:uncharacterized protein YqjF (DUF2071 family)